MNKPNTELDKAIEEVKRIESAVKFPAITASNAVSIAYHLEIGEDNGAISRGSLAQLLRAHATELQALYLAQLGFRKWFPVVESATKRLERENQQLREALKECGEALLKAQHEARREYQNNYGKECFVTRFDNALSHPLVQAALKS